MINIDRDHKIEVLLLAGLDQQRDDMDHDCSGARQRAPARRPGPEPQGARFARDRDARADQRRRSGPAAPGRVARRAAPAAPKRSMIAASAGVPGSTTSRASTSASMMTAPRAASSAATMLFPDAMPPVRATRSTMAEATAASARARPPADAEGPQFA